MEPKLNFEYSVDEMMEYISNEYTAPELVERLGLDVDDLIDELEHIILEERESFDNEMTMDKRRD